MQRLHTLSNHFTSTSEAEEKELEVGLLEKYKNMSQLDINYLKKLINLDESYPLLQEFEKIFRDHQFFEQETYEDDDRQMKMIKANRRV